MREPGDLSLPAQAVAGIREALPVIAEDAVAAIIAEVPSYADAFSGPMGATIRTAVEVALGGFLSLAAGRGGTATAPTATAVDGAYQLGRGEARHERSSEVILSAYRIGARVSWRAMAERGVASGLDARTLAAFAELVFAYIDELSAASVAGYHDELATAGRLRQRQRERLAHHLLTGSPADVVLGAAERAEWSLPATLTAVLLAESQVRAVISALPPGTLQAADPPGLTPDDGVLLLVPDSHGAGRAALLRAVRGRHAVVGPARPWEAVRASADRVVRAHRAGLAGDTEEHLPALVLSADAEARADLRARVLAPLAALRPAAREKLAETLRAWVLHQGRRDDVAAALFVHPQTVRYRVAQLREAYGDRLEDPDFVLAATIGLG